MKKTTPSPWARTLFYLVGHLVAERSADPTYASHCRIVTPPSVHDNPYTHTQAYLVSPM